MKLKVFEPRGCSLSHRKRLACSPSCSSYTVSAPVLTFLNCLNFSLLQPLRVCKTRSVTPCTHTRIQTTVHDLEHQKHTHTHTHTTAVLQLHQPTSAVSSNIPAHHNTMSPHSTVSVHHHCWLHLVYRNLPTTAAQLFSTSHPLPETVEPRLTVRAVTAGTYRAD